MDALSSATKTNLMRGARSSLRYCSRVLQLPATTYYMGFEGGRVVAEAMREIRLTCVYYFYSIIREHLADFCKKIT
jgi:hypothetical protein